MNDESFSIEYTIIDKDDKRHFVTEQIVAVPFPHTNRYIRDHLEIFDYYSLNEEKLKEKFKFYNQEIQTVNDIIIKFIYNDRTEEVYSSFKKKDLEADLSRFRAKVLNTK
jgi:hypothetical protein